MVLLIFALALGVSGESLSEPSWSLAELPRPDLSAIDPALRDQLEAARQRFDELVQGSMPSATASTERLAVATGHMAEIYHVHEFHRAAQVAYRNASQLSSEEARWAYGAGLVALELAEPEEALASFDKVLVAEPDDLPSLLRSGQLLISLDRLPEARERFEQAKHLDPGCAVALRGMAQIAASSGDFERAVMLYRQVLELQPKASIVHYPLAQALRRTGDLEAARQQLTRRGNVEVSFEDPRLDRLARIAKASAVEVLLAQVERLGVTPRELVGFAVTHLSDTPGAVEYLEAAASRWDVEGEEHGRLELARLNTMISGLLVARRQDAEALDHARSAIELASSRDGSASLAADREPTRHEAAHKVMVAASLYAAGILDRRQHYGEALTYYATVLELAPDSVDALAGRARALVELDRAAKAVPALERLAQLEPEDGTVRLRLGMVRQRLGQARAASDAYRAALASELEASDAALAHGNLATLALRRGDFEFALVELERAVELDPGSVMLRLRLADAFGGHDRYVEAAQHYAAAIELQPNHEAARVGEVSALIFAERFAEARARLETGVLDLAQSRRMTHLLARFLAAAPSSALRDGQRALGLATELFRWRQNLIHGETVAMALAQLGRFDAAVELQDRLLQALKEAAQPLAEQRLRANLELYRAGRRCCAQEAYVVLLPIAETAVDS
ncbi:MAG: tetratricopeptide repeat protein [Acidobacteriota bacterium]